LNQYELSLDIPIILLGTGANGVNRHVEVLNSLTKYNSSFQVVALCGNNNKIYDRILTIKNLFNFKVVPLKIIDDRAMTLLLTEAKFLFARPGAGTTTEAIVCGTPVIFDISRGAMPQEINNLNFWKYRSSSCVLSRNPRNIHQLIKPSLPKIKIELGSSPKLLLERLSQLCLNS